MDSQESKAALESRIKSNLVEVRARIDAANDNDRSITLVGVTKMFGPEVAAAAFRCGIADLGENYAQHLHSKATELVDLPIRWHFIGGLQRNKIKRYGRHVSLWQTIDRMELIEELAKRYPGAELLIQVNTTSEEQKSGCNPLDLGPLVDRGRELGLGLRGLMTVGPTSAEADPRPSFERLSELAAGHELEELSMGMSGDFETAISYGATIVRLGSILFGNRPRPASPSLT